MKRKGFGGIKSAFAAWGLLPAALLGVFAALPLSTAQSHAQAPVVEAADPSAPMVVEADELTYDDVNGTVTATGNVRIFYDGYTVEALEVSYDRANGRVRARGNVRITEPGGNIVYTDFADLTDTFSEGFVEALRVETPENTRFAADRATRRDGNVTVFERGVYTACEACRTDPTRPPLWQIKATRIIHDQGEQMVYYEGARLEFFGVPIAYLPFFAHADPTVKRQSGFLRPDYVYNQNIGVRIGAPYYLALAPNYDLTITPRYSTRQGFMLGGEFRHRLSNGSYDVRGAITQQENRQVFAGTPGERDWRGYVASRGRFELNRDWTLGWDATYLSDATFFRDHKLESASAQEIVSQIYLTGLGERRFFDARLQRFEVTRNPALFRVPNNIAFTNPDFLVTDETEFQPVIHPLVDYEGVTDERVLGGELSFDFNITSLSRESDHVTRYGYDPTVTAGAFNVQELTTPLYTGYAGTYTRATMDVAWRREMVGPMGMVVTPHLGVRGDVGIFDLDNGGGTLTAGEDGFARIMPTAALEWRWPFLVVAGWGSQIIEPVAQIIARPDEMMAGEMPNEDAQSLVFETANLFDFDKFSGYDRVEGGVRANLGLRYTAQFAGGGSIAAMIGQSFHLAGDNPYQVADATLTGAETGLETDRSDYVASLSAVPLPGTYFSVRARLDEDDLELRRLEAIASTAQGPVTAGVRYTYLGARPTHAIFDDRQEVSGSLSLRFAENWRAYGGTTYDIGNSAHVTSSIGLAYDDECLTIALSYTNTANRYSDTVDPGHTFGLRVDLRTLGAFDGSTRVSDLIAN